MWVRSTEVLWRTAPEYLALGRLDGSVDQVHGPGAAIWILLANPIDESELLTSLARRYGVDPNDIAGDVLELLWQLEAGGYARRIP